MTISGSGLSPDVLRPDRKRDPRLAAEVDLEAARWADITTLVDLLTDDERIAPGYFREPDWSVRDLIAHLGWWQAKARSELLTIASRSYTAHDFDVDRRNAESLAANRGVPWDDVWARTTAARAWMLEAWFGLAGRSPAADRWVRKAGAEHYDEHLDPLRAWTAELIDSRTRPRVDERDP